MPMVYLQIIKNKTKEAQKIVRNIKKAMKVITQKHDEEANIASRLLEFHFIMLSTTDKLTT